MSESTEDIDKITAPPAPVQKIWPSRSNVVKCVILVLVGLGLGISSALVADWVPAGISLVLFLYGSCSIGWVEIEGDRITHRRLVRGGSARLIEIREIGLGVQRVKTSKWWFPVIDTHDGRSIDLASLKSLSRKRAEARVQRIHSMLESASAVRSDGPTFAKILGGQDEAVETVESEDDPTDDFDLTPGYTAYLREKALEEAAAASAAPPTLTTPEAPIADLAPVAAVAVADSVPTPAPLASEPAPQVFEPQPAPQVFEPQPAPQVFEPQPAPQVLEPQPAPALAVFAPQATAAPTPEPQQQAEQQAQLAQQQAQQQAYAQQQAQLAQQQAQQQAYAQQQAQLAQQQAYAQQQAQLAQQQAQQQAYERQQAQLAQQQAQQQAYAHQQAA